ncbi:hypothetical protein CA13_17560 [Planctomycetes bacterium CA13]|uniref:Uncharacterized protein n=1 Tax=Novipirellula herctigrandis TaxID=2527986 RepID=A0A5C5Z0Y1_9BACT|nr:hypothetical protein CA13_17560 [Planctomycetes bacterium CA13]
MFILTIIVGVFALIALAMPDLVLLSFLLIVPGIVLMMAPTVFVYLAAATAIRSILPYGTGVTATSFALFAAGVLGYLVAWPFQMMGEREYRALIQEDVVSATPLKLLGHVRLERRDISHWKRDQEKECDHLCAALLLTPGVKSVTLAKGKDLQQVTNWQLVPRGSVSDTGLAPTKPEDIFHQYPAKVNRDLNGVSFHEFNQARREQLAAEWNLRLATRETLLASDTAPVPDMTIAITHLREKSQPSVQRVEVLDKAGVMLFRRSLIKHAVVQAPFYITFQANLSNSHFAIGRKLFSTGKRYERFNPVTELIQHLSGIRHTPSGEAPQQVKQLLQAALDNLEGSPPELALAVPWLSGIDNRALSDEDAVLVHRVVGDLRIQNVGEALRHVYPKKTPLEFRSILVQRIIAPETNATDRGHFAYLLSKMPAGTFADMTEQEWQIINDPTLRKDALPFVERLADLGKSGVEPLLMILQHAVTTMTHWYMRRPTIDVVCRGFTRLGADGKEALPTIQSLFEQKRSPITNSANDAFAWRVAMARMGLAIDELPYPPSWKEQSIAKMREKVSRRLADFDSDEFSK